VSTRNADDTGGMTVATSTPTTSTATDDSRDTDIDIVDVAVFFIRRLDDRDWDSLLVSLFWKIHISRTMDE